jgi:hypothetical protein
MKERQTKTKTKQNQETRKTKCTFSHIDIRYICITLFIGYGVEKYENKKLKYIVPLNMLLTMKMDKMKVCVCICFVVVLCFGFVSVCLYT